MIDYNPIISSKKRESKVLEVLSVGLLVLAIYLFTFLQDSKKENMDFVNYDQEIEKMYHPENFEPTSEDQEESEDYDNA